MAPRTRLLLVACLLAGASLAGCASKAERADPRVVQAVADTKPERWTPGDWWSYRATIHGNRTYEVDLVVDRAGPQGFSLGTNRSNGFFGLPFTGNVTRELNPLIGSEEWPMYRFPLSDGATWTYHLWGHDGKTVARAAMVDVPGRGPEPGFRFEATSLGQVFARYDYAPSVGWFTGLTLIDPAKRATVLEVELRGFGPNYRGLYFVEETLAVARFQSPGDLPTPIVLQVPSADSEARIHLSVAWTAGACEATVRDESGATLAHAQVLGVGSSGDQGTAPPGAHTLVLEPRCVGAGTVHVAVTGVKAREGLARRAGT